MDKKPAKTAAEIEAWFAEYIARELDISADEIDPTSTFDQFALDSATAIGMTGDLEDWLDTRIDPSLVYDYPTIEAMSKYLAEN